MDTAQQRWYFYWRSQVRRNNYLPTDLSYIFVHVYELLDLVEMPDPVQAASRLWVLWHRYRTQLPKLDRYVPEWGGDLLAVKRDVNSGLLWWQKSLEHNVDLSEPVINALIQVYIAAGTTAQMPYGIWQQLTAYRPRNKFYSEHNTDGQIDRAYEKAIRLAADYWQRTTHQSVLEQLAPAGIVALHKPVFVSAPIGYAYPQYIDLGQGRNYLASPQLSTHLTSVIKYAENILRKQTGFSRKLSGIQLDAGLAQALDAAFAPEAVASAPVRIKIDPARVAVLQKEGDAIGALLSTELDEVGTSAPVKPLYTELAEVRQIWASLELPDRQTIAAIYRKHVTRVDQLGPNLANFALLPDTVVNRINERALPLLGDRLIYTESNGNLTLAEDFLDELDVVIAESPPEAGAATVVGASADGPWDQLLSTLLPVEAALIQLFADHGSLTEPEIDAMTRPYHSMGNAVLDGLNEKAVELIGHAPIYPDADKWIMEEDDLASLHEHLAKQRTN